MLMMSLPNRCMPCTMASLLTAVEKACEQILDWQKADTFTCSPFLGRHWNVSAQVEQTACVGFCDKGPPATGNTLACIFVIEEDRVVAEISLEVVRPKIRY